MNTEESITILEVIKRSGSFPVHCSHRGGGHEFFGPENTMFTFRKSVECKTRLLEIDLRVSKDSHLVIMHDDDIDRTCDGEGLVSDFTLAELKQFNAAKNFPEFTDVRIPTFVEFLDEFLQHSDLMFMLDFKDSHSIELTLEMIAQRKMQHRVILGSVDQDCNRLLARLKPPSVPLITDVSATLAIATAYYTGFLGYMKIEHNIFGYILNSGTTMFWTKGLIDALHLAGCQVLVCGDALDNEDIQRQCIEYGVDFIMTDRPDILTETMKSCKLMD
jgi:glycerophosphoryl diester phosphodiesterase